MILIFLKKNPKNTKVFPFWKKDSAKKKKKTLGHK
jgi:hypothetical protein